MVEDLYYNINEVREQKRKIQRLTEQNDALRQARNEAMNRSKKARRDYAGNKEDWGSKVEGRFPNANPRGQPGGEWEGKRDRSHESTRNRERPNSIEFKPIETQDKGEENVTGEPTQIQNEVIIYPESSHNSIQAPFNPGNVAAPIRERRTRSGKIKRCSAKTGYISLT